MIYRIRDWDKYFETHETRKLKRLAWVPVPNKHDGLGYRLLMAEPNGYQHYAAWLLLVQVASKCPRRGTLADDSGNGLNAEQLAAKTGAPSRAFAAAFEALVKVGWLEVLPENLPERREITGDSPDVPGPPPVGREGKGREQKGKELTDSPEAAKNRRSGPPSPSVLTFDTVGKTKTWELTQAQLEKWRSMYPNLDVLGECRKALAWSQAKPENRKTFAGMPVFLVRWMNRAVETSPCARNDRLFGGASPRRNGSSFDEHPEGQVPPEFMDPDDPETEVTNA